MAFTILRDNFYADALPGFADIAALVLRDPDRHVDATYTLTGPQALTLPEVATRAGAVLGRDLRFENQTVEEAYAFRAAAYDAEQWQLDAEQ